MMVLKQMVIRLRIQIKSFVMRSTAVRIASSGGENKAKGFSQSPAVKDAYMEEISDEKYLINKWPAKPFAYAMNVVPPLIVSNVQGETLTMEGMLMIGLATLLFARIGKRMCYGAPISKSDHDFICEELKLKMKKSAQEEITNLKHSHNLQMLSAQEEISDLKHSHKLQMMNLKLKMMTGAQKELSKLMNSHELEIQSAEEEISKLKHCNKRKDMEIQTLKRKLHPWMQGKRWKV